MTGNCIRKPARVIVLAVCMFVWRQPASAQEMRKYELSAGYAPVHFDGTAGGLSLHGVDVSLARNVNRWLAVVGDAGGYHSEGFRLGTVQAGTRFTARPGRWVSAFSQTLLGVAHANAGARGFPAYHESVAWTVGGGLDWRLSGRVSLRVVQAEYVQTRLGGQVQHNLRAGAAIVVRFGGR